MNSSLEGKKLCGGSSSDLIGEWEDLGFRFGGLDSDLGRFLGIESIFEGFRMRTLKSENKCWDEKENKITNFPKKKKTNYVCWHLIDGLLLTHFEPELNFRNMINEKHKAQLYSVEEAKIDSGQVRFFRDSIQIKI